MNGASTRQPTTAKNPLFEDGRIPEVEVSINSACSLSCAECGFLVPNQPHPATGRDPVVELEEMLRRLEEADVRIGSVALLGGEATLAPRTLERSVDLLAKSNIVERVELVTNGLTPQGLPSACLSNIDRISLSDYTGDDRLADAWRCWLTGLGRDDIEFVVRRHSGWDNNSASVILSPAQAQAAYDRCWYRRHCVTLERGRLFRCSRIPKVGLDHDGLPLERGTSSATVLGYLHDPTAPRACRTCAPMAGLPRIAPGSQPDDRVPRLLKRALDWFSSQGVAQ